MNPFLFRPVWLRLAWVAGFLSIAGWATILGQTSSIHTLDRLTEVLATTSDTQERLDILRGIASALQGRRSVPAPSGWTQLEEILDASDNSEVRALTQSLGLTFGSERAARSLRKTVSDRSAPDNIRRNALEALVRVHDTSLAPELQSLVADPAVRNLAIRGLGNYDDANTPAAILAVYGQLNGGERRDALNTLSSRAGYALPLLKAVESGIVPKAELTADLVRQLRNLKDESIRSRLTELWGVIRETSPDMQAEIERYKGLYWAGGSQPGDAQRGRVVFNRICAQCHHLFDTGGAVGPEITGANRGDLDYLLQNILYPNAVIPNEYRAATLEMKDGRVVTGIIKSQDANGYRVQTVNEQLVLPKSDINRVEQSDISMMPEGLISTLQPQEIRDLLYYLGRPGQVPLAVGK